MGVGCNPCREVVQACEFGAFAKIRLCEVRELALEYVIERMDGTKVVNLGLEK